MGGTLPGAAQSLLSLGWVFSTVKPIKGQVYSSTCATRPPALCWDGDAGTVTPAEPGSWGVSSGLQENGSLLEVPLPGAGVGAEPPSRASLAAQPDPGLGGCLQTPRRAPEGERGTGLPRPGCFRQHKHLNYLYWSLSFLVM